MNKKYIVRLGKDERDQLTQMVSTGKSAAYKIKHANILSKSDANGPNWPAAQVAAAFSCAQQTVYNVRQRFVTQGLDAALERKHRKQPPYAPILDGEGQARLLQIACSEPPAGMRAGHCDYLRTN